MTAVAIHQPNFLPWAGFWHKLISADVFVIYAGVQFEKNGYQNRVKFEDNGGWATVPVSGGMVPIRDIRIADRRAPAKIARRIRQWSARAPHRERLNPIVSALEAADDRLVHLNVALIKIMADILGARADLVVDLETRKHLSTGEALTEVARACGDVYLSGGDGPKYLRREQLDLETVLLQRVEGVADHSMIHAIAELDDPLSAFVGCGWQEWRRCEP